MPTASCEQSSEALDDLDAMTLQQQVDLAREQVRHGRGSSLQDVLARL